MNSIAFTNTDWLKGGSPCSLFSAEFSGCPTAREVCSKLGFNWEQQPLMVEFVSCTAIQELLNGDIKLSEGSEEYFSQVSVSTACRFICAGQQALNWLRDPQSKVDKIPELGGILELQEDLHPLVKAVSYTSAQTYAALRKTILSDLIDNLKKLLPQEKLRLPWEEQDEIYVAKFLFRYFQQQTSDKSKHSELLAKVWFHNLSDNFSRISGIELETEHNLNRTRNADEVYSKMNACFKPGNDSDSKFFYLNCGIKLIQAILIHSFQVNFSQTTENFATQAGEELLSSLLRLYSGKDITRNDIKASAIAFDREYQILIIPDFQAQEADRNLFA